MDDKRACVYCEKTGDLRPYGPAGAMVCFPCAMETPARATEAKRRFGDQLDAASDSSATGTAVIDGSDVGPYPIEHAALAAEVE